MKAKLVDSMPSGDWIYEIKFDGYRALALRGGSEARVLSRNEKDLGGKFPEVKDSIAALNIQEAIVDKEFDFDSRRELLSNPIAPQSTEKHKFLSPNRWRPGRVPRFCEEWILLSSFVAFRGGPPAILPSISTLFAPQAQDAINQGLESKHRCWKTGACTCVESHRKIVLSRCRIPKSTGYEFIFFCNAR